MDDVCAKAVDWAALHGILMRLPQKDSNVALSHVPFALFPMPFPKNLYDLAQSLQPVLNELVDAISKDYDFIVNIFEHVRQEGVMQVFPRERSILTLKEWRLGIHRSDYMLHQDGQHTKLQQVELNTISSSFASLSSRVGDLHKELFKDEDYVKLFKGPLSEGVLSTSDSLEAVSRAISDAWKVYNESKSIVLFVVQPNERNIYDQRLIEKGLLGHGIRSRRATLSQIAEKAQLKGNERKLYFNGEEVAIAYFRSGYAPTDYTGEKDWEARLLVERSFAIKCPTIAYHLVGSKKIQQVLAQPGVLEKFVPEYESNLLRSAFTGLHPLDESEAGKLAVEQALSNPQKYVMKPQREGGGNNIYGEDVKTALLKLSLEERKAYILMDLIAAPTSKSVMVRHGQYVAMDTISELGIYGVWLSNSNTVAFNRSAGHLLRTKAADSNEGGVAAGFAVLNSPFLV
ncbi:glutathione synthase [Chytridium lagenaria]|nr:glutathione synthase [Chytridium lagenaria]